MGRISGNHIANYSQTMLHFFPGDKRKLYRSRKIQSKCQDLTFAQIAHSVNLKMEETNPQHKVDSLQSPTDANEIQLLIQAASTVSIDNPPIDVTIDSEGSFANPIERYEGPEDLRPDVIFEKLEIKTILNRSIKELSLVEKKILQMKGINI